MSEVVHTKSKERVRDLGEVFTPPKVANQMLDLLEKDKPGIWADLEGRIGFLREGEKSKGSAGTGSILIPFGRKNIGSILSSDLKGRWFQ